jgi:uncharacterized protein YndB with AHSA1/START domain
MSTRGGEITPAITLRPASLGASASIPPTDPNQSATRSEFNTSMAEYRFLDEWFVPAPPETVYDVIGAGLEYPDWRGDVFLEAEGDSGPPAPGRRVRVKARGYLPYRLRFISEVVECERPKRIRMRLSGDFEGGGEWRFKPVEGGTRATLDWRPIVNKPVVRYLTPVLRPLFASNHYWTMRRGEEHIRERVRS